MTSQPTRTDPEFEDRTFLVIFNQKAKATNDAILTELESWANVQETCYNLDVKGDLPEEDRYDRATVVLKSENNIAGVMNMLRAHDGVQSVLPPLKYLLC